MRHQGRPLPLVERLQQLARRLGGDDSGGEDQRLAPALVEDQQQGRNDRQQRQDREATERGDVADRLLQPTGAKRVLRLAGRTQRQKKLAIESVGPALGHLPGHDQEKP